MTYDKLECTSEYKNIGKMNAYDGTKEQVLFILLFILFGIWSSCCVLRVTSNLNKRNLLLPVFIFDLNRIAGKLK